MKTLTQYCFLIPLEYICRLLYIITLHYNILSNYFNSPQTSYSRFFPDALNVNSHSKLEF